QLSALRRYFCSWPGNQSDAPAVGAFRKLPHHPATNLHEHVSAWARTGAGGWPAPRSSMDWPVYYHGCHVFRIVLDAPGMVSTRMGAMRRNAGRAPIRHSELLDEYLLERFTARSRRRPGAGITAAARKIPACAGCVAHGPWSHNPVQQPPL